MQHDGAVDVPYRVLHAIVGHQFPVYFINAVKSVLLMTGNDDIIVVDNASNLPRLTLELQSISDKESRVHLLLRETNDISRNSKVGGLYDAYNEVVSYALRQGYDYLHIMQNDMQMLWWDESVMRRARSIQPGAFSGRAGVSPSRRPAASGMRLPSGGRVRLSSSLPGGGGT